MKGKKDKVNRILAIKWIKNYQATTLTYSEIESI